MVNTYNLVNPCIKGQFKSELKLKIHQKLKELYNKCQAF